MNGSLNLQDKIANYFLTLWYQLNSFIFVRFMSKNVILIVEIKVFNTNSNYPKEIDCFSILAFSFFFQSILIWGESEEIKYFLLSLLKRLSKKGIEWQTIDLWESRHMFDPIKLLNCSCIMMIILMLSGNWLWGFLKV